MTAQRLDGVVPHDRFGPPVSLRIVPFVIGADLTGDLRIWDDTLVQEDARVGLDLDVDQSPPAHK